MHEKCVGLGGEQAGELAEISCFKVSGSAFGLQRIGLQCGLFSDHWCADAMCSDMWIVLIILLLIPDVIPMWI